jgi:chromosome partitioning protein
MGRVISIFNQKGGVGKTTTNINLCSELALLGKKVLCIDNDPQGNTTSGLGQEKKEVDSTIYDLLMYISSIKYNEVSDEIKKRNIYTAIIKTDFENIYLIPANKTLADAEINLSNKYSRETLLKKMIDVIREDFDYICIDCPPALGLLSVNALVACDSVIIPISPGLFATEGMAEIQETINLIQDGLNDKLEIMGVLITLFDIRENISKDLKNALHDVFGNQVFKTVIRVNSAIKYAQENRQPINYYDTQCNGHIDYLNLAKEVISK